MSLLSLLTGNRHATRQQVSYAGGAGQSPADPVIIIAPSSLAGVPAEYAHVMKKCGMKGVDWNLKSQALIGKQSDGKVMDVLKVELQDGTVRQFYFDISSFYGRF